MFIGGIVLNLILVIGLLIDPRARSRDTVSPGPLGHIKQQFFSAKLVQANRSVAGVATASLVLVSGLYIQELSTQDSSLGLNRVTTPTGGETVPTPPVPVTYEPRIAEEDLRHLLGHSIAARETFQNVASRERTLAESRAQTRIGALSQRAYSAEQIEAAVFAVVTVMLEARQARGGEIENPNQQAERARQALSGDAVEATLRARFEEMLSLQAQTEGADISIGVLPSDTEITWQISVMLAQLGLPPTALGDEERRAATSQVHTLLRSRSPAGSVSPEPPDPVAVEEAVNSTIVIAPLDVGLSALGSAVEVWQALDPLPEAATRDARSVMAEVDQAGAQFRESLTRVERAVEAGSLTISELDAIVAILTDANGGLRNAIFEAQALPDLPVYPPEPVVEVVDDTAREADNTSSGATTPPRPISIQVEVGDRTTTLTAATWVSLAALLVFLLASMSFQMRVRSGEFGRHRDEMRQLMAFALKRGLGPMPPPAPAMGAAP